MENSPDKLFRDARQLSRKPTLDIQQSLLRLHPTLLSEIQIWYDGLRIVDEEDIDFEDGYENLGPPPVLDTTQRRIVEIASKNFSCTLVNEGIPRALNLQILYEGPPDPSMMETVLNGGFGNITAVNLASPREFITEIVEEDLSISNVTWIVSKVAVKYNEQYYKKHEYKFCTRVVREARIWSRMKHRNIVPLLGLWKNFNVNSVFHSFVSPWFEEGSLKKCYETMTLSIRQKLEFLRDIASALVYMHNHDFEAVHGDLRADNVLVKERRAYLADFGLSRLHDDVKGFSSSRETGNAQWIAPERCLDVSEMATKSSDIYEFASVFYEIWTEKEPWDNAPSSIVLVAINKGLRPPQPRNMPEDYWNFISKCWLAKNTLRPSADDALASICSFLKNVADK